MNQISMNTLDLMRAADMLDEDNVLIGDAISALAGCLEQYGGDEDERVTADAIVRTVDTVASMISDLEGNHGALTFLMDVHAQASAVASSG